MNGQTLTFADTLESTECFYIVTHFIQERTKTAALVIALLGLPRPEDSLNAKGVVEQRKGRELVLGLAAHPKQRSLSRGHTGSHSVGISLSITTSTQLPLSLQHHDTGPGINDHTCTFLPVPRKSLSLPILHMEAQVVIITTTLIISLAHKKIPSTKVQARRPLRTGAQWASLSLAATNVVEVSSQAASSLAGMPSFSLPRIKIPYTSQQISCPP
jgi:hypothetical protein